MVDENKETPQDELTGEPIVTVENEAPPASEASDTPATADQSDAPGKTDAPAPESEGSTPESSADSGEPDHGLTLGTGSPSEDEDEARPRPAPTIRGKVDRFGVAMGTGRRKTSVARVRVKDGAGEVVINGRPMDEYVVLERDRLLVLAPLRAVEMDGKVDIAVNVQGGGPTGQAGAIVLGIARALQAKNPEYHVALSDGGYLTRDSRMVERKKYGHKKARRSFQFSKR